MITRPLRGPRNGLGCRPGGNPYFFVPTYVGQRNNSYPTRGRYHTPGPGAVYVPALGESACAGECAGSDRRVAVRDYAVRIRGFSQDTFGGICAGPAGAVQPRAARGQARARLPVLPHHGGE